ncbi:hypothetical protein AJ87_45465 [Rhizobium yanglingense]|nr:hypothetical protein AJ87_45465 [Rhizobium yanglingense]
MIFDNQPVHTALYQGLGVAQAGVIDGVHLFAAVTRRAGKGGAMDHADQRLVSPEYFPYGA